MLRHGILGLISNGEKTGYEIMTVFRDSLNHFWTAQTSQIYRELQTMEKAGWISQRHIPQAGKPDKNVFSITPAGREELLSIFTVDTEDNCILRIREAFPQLSRKDAMKLKKKTDKRRGDYYQYFTGKAWGDMNSYGMVLNCSAVGGAEIAAELLAATALSQTR